MLNFNLELETPTGNVKPNAPATPFARDPLLRAAVVAPGIHVSPQRACNGSLPSLAAPAAGDTPNAQRERQEMAAASLLVRQGVARGVDVAVVQLVDRRRDPPGDAQEWTFQRDVEAVLYGNGYAQTTGAVYRLLQRSGVVRESLALKKACVQQGIVTQDEFDCLRGHLGDVRSFTLIPLVALRTALSVFRLR